MYIPNNIVTKFTDSNEMIDVVNNTKAGSVWDNIIITKRDLSVKSVINTKEKEYATDDKNEELIFFIRFINFLFIKFRINK
jgi:hypothetical protein